MFAERDAAAIAGDECFGGFHAGFDFLVLSESERWIALVFFFLIEEVSAADAVGAVVRVRIDEDSVDNGKNGGGGADAECKRETREDCREA